ncbi:hypothetical protein [Parasphaerochaeta coccoides]|uniref:Uncharacterized protein n=1 Tax=Parasphaerochaeta coccoides (strain ATCC BAA-1237 / DSM 17374 / SPN1) TaxID=760011 RepID=F4GHD5_PARC1|nr:hypothetical protein [Parasphaerochaeta coccoides]AEC02034.1 hypothetical protein Spico_0809 [Parasphaerochaeta coccoides DSM 17374]
MKITSTDGRSGFCKELLEVTKATASYSGGFAFIKAKGVSSYFDTLLDASISGSKVLPIGAPVHVPAWAAAAQSPLTEGDVIIPIDMSVSCWTTDVARSRQEGTVDLTTQCDVINGRRTVVGDGNIVDSGTISGLFDTESDMQRELEGLFSKRIVDSGAGSGRKVSFIPRQKDKTYWHWMARREMSELGEVEITIFRKMRIAQIDSGQPATGGVPFNFNYETQDDWQYEKVVTA